MGRTVVYVEQFTPDHTYFSLYSPRDVPGADAKTELTLGADTAPLTQLDQGVLNPDIVKRAGSILFNSLVAQAAVDMRMKTVLVNGNEVCPIYLHLESDVAERLPWETLCTDTGRFLALSDRWQVGRIVGSLGASHLDTVNVPFRPPLQIMAFLAAEGIDARPEWDALYKAMDESKIQTEVTIFVAQDNLMKHLQSIQNPLVTIKPSFMSTNFRFKDVLANSGSVPHIVHFFCHGSTDFGPHLELSILTGDIATLTPEDFKEIPKSPNLWLVTLNCCKGGATADNQGGDSFIRAIVRNAYAPVAVGMREPVDKADANEFSETFYGAVLSVVKNALANGVTPTTLEWASALYEPRRALATRHRKTKPWEVAATFTKEWTLPVLYSQPSTFLLSALPQNVDIQTWYNDALKLNVQRAMRNAIAANPAITPEILADLDAGIKELEKNLFGNGNGN